MTSAAHLPLGWGHLSALEEVTERSPGLLVLAIVTPVSILCEILVTPEARDLPLGNLGCMLVIHDEKMKERNFFSKKKREEKRRKREKSVSGG